MMHPDTDISHITERKDLHTFSRMTGALTLPICKMSLKHQSNIGQMPFWTFGNYSAGTKP